MSQDTGAEATITLGELERMLTQIQRDADANVQMLDQAVAAMQQGGVGGSILQRYAQMQDQAAVITDAAYGADQSLETNRALRDAYAANPDAGDKQFLTDE